MVAIDIKYLGGLRCEATHGPSGTKVLTDAPVDNHGEGKYFSPTDLAATSLGTCMMTLMGIYAKRKEIELTGTSIHVEKIMSQEPPRRIAKLVVHFDLPLEAGHPEIPALERAAKTCPVHQSLSPEIEMDIQFHWKQG